MGKHEKKISENINRNKEYIKEFEEWLIDNNLVEKTIRKHIFNIELYLNDYLNYYDIYTMEDGIHSVHSYLSGWFIEKCMWSSKTTIKENAASIKKFYKYMSEKGYVKLNDYHLLVREIRDSMDEYMDMMDAYNKGTYYDMFD